MSLGSPLGNPLGNPLGLARNSAGDYSRLLNDPTIVDFISSAGVSGTYKVPAWAKFMRVTVVGGGAAGRTVIAGGGGGGLAQTKILNISGKSIDLTYSTAARRVADTPGQAQSSSAAFLNYAMTATGGTNIAGQATGTGTGGDFNFSGGASVTNGTNGGAGSGAAGPRGNGGTGAPSAQKEGVGGAGGGGGQKGGGQFGGGGGVGSPGSASDGTLQTPPGDTGLWGSASFNVDGGRWGGGGSGGGLAGAGGEGGVRIELW